MSSNHSEFGGDYYCENHHALFESHEAVNNYAKCPWCDSDISGLI
jgi:transcription initiation factor IIE alpha subunit